MKKSLTVAALFAAAAMSATPTLSADMAAPEAPAIKPICYFLPLLPDCIAAFKAHHDAEVAEGKTITPPAMPAMPTMPPMPKCTPAEKGAGHLLDCK